MTSTPASIDVLERDLTAALAHGTVEAFVALLTDDVRWGGEHGGNECTSKVQAGDHYAGLLEAGLALSARNVRPARTSRHDESTVLVDLTVDAPDPDDYPGELTIRLTLRDGLICDIRELDPPPQIEVLYIDDCPNHDALLPHLDALLAEHEIEAVVRVVHIAGPDEARRHRFRGSPTVRVNGIDVDPVPFVPAAQDDHDLRCRLYPRPSGGGAAGVPPDEWILDALLDNPVHQAAMAAIREGDLAGLARAISSRPELPRQRLVRHGGRTLLHVATDWPGHFPGVADTIAALVSAGADPNVPVLGEHPETPLHWAASSGDLDAINALLDAGADVDVRGAVIAAGTPMADATAFGQWAAARLLLERGATTNLFEAAALGLESRVDTLLEHERPSREIITSSLWGACHGGQLGTAAILLTHGADLNWIGYDDLTPLDAARRAEATELVDMLLGCGATGRLTT